MWALSTTLLAAGLEAQEARAGKARTVSPKMSEAIRARVPPYDPAAASAASKAATGGAQDGDDLLVLPKMTVKERAFPPGAVRLADDARLALAMKNHPALILGGFGRQGDVAELLSREEILALHQRETAAIVNHATLDPDTPGARKIRKLLGASIQQPSQYWSYDRGKGKP